MELVKLKGADFGIEETKAQQISAQFKPMLDKMVELEKEYNKVIKLPKNNPDTAEKAGELRRKLVKVRTGTAEIHKEQKAFYLAGGRFVDAWKNAQLFASQGLEEKLLEIETYQQRLEAERVENLRVEREEALKPYHNDFTGLNLGAMQADVWEAYFDKKKRDWEDLRRAEEEAEAKRLEEERLEKMAKERFGILAPYGAYISGFDEIDFKTMPQSTFDALVEDVMFAEAENIRKQKLADERIKALRPFSNFVAWDDYDFAEITDEEFAVILNDATKADADYKSQLAKQEEENARLKAEADAKEKARQEAEAKAKAEAEAKEKERLAQLEEERKKREALEAELKAKREKEEAEARAKAEAEAKAKAEADKLAKAGDKKRLLAWIEQFEALPQLPEGKQMKEGSTALVENIKARFEGFKKWAKEEAEKL